MRYLIKFGYDGTKFHGFQRQNDVKNVQGTLENVLSKVLKSNILIKGSGRTDAGVHAHMQCAHFDYDGSVSNKDIDKINILLNNEIIIKKVKYLCTNRKYLTFFWKIFHYNCAELTVLYRKRKSCV